MPAAAAKRASRKSSPAGGKQPARSRSSSKSRSKSASPTAKPRGRSSSKSRAVEKKSPTPQKQQQQQKPRSRSNSRSRGRPAASPASATSTPSQQPPAKKAPRQATPTVAKQRRSTGGVNHSESPTRSKAATAATGTSVVTTTATAATAASSGSPSPSARAAASSSSSGREFGGSIGAALMIIGLPISLVWLSLLSDGKVTFSRSNRWLFGFPKAIGLADLFSLRAALIYAGWILCQLVLYCLPVGGKWVQHEGGRYHCNGLFALLVSMVGFALANWWGLPASRIICSELTRLSATACLFSALLSIGLYIRSLRLPASALTLDAASAKRSSTGNSGCCGAASGCCDAVYNFFMGRELHPRLFNGFIDLKFFLEMRPGLIGWILLDMAYMYQSKASGHAVGLPFAMLTFMHLMYVGDALLFERSILTTTDIKREGLGYMLTFGNLAWVPFFYSLSARQLIGRSPIMPAYCLAGVAIINLFGYWLFRISNYQKDLFRCDPHHSTFNNWPTVPTGVRGRQLLAGGLWGRLRHPNFVGDIVMSVAWSLAAGFHAPLAWLYPAYLLVLLVHRARRDEIHCSAKYGLAWRRYCELVPWRFLPKVY